MARRSRRPARRRPASRRGAASARNGQVPWGIIALGAVAVGGAAFLFYRAASASAGPQAQPAPLPLGVTVTSPSRSLPSSVADTLRSSDLARQIFGLQALIYSFGSSEQVPDGQLATLNSELALIAGVNDTGSVSPSYSASSYPQVRQWLYGIDPNRMQQQLTALRSLPYTMPQDLIDAVNASVASVDSSRIALQVQPEMSPASQALMPAG